VASGAATSATAAAAAPPPPLGRAQALQLQQMLTHYTQQLLKKHKLNSAQAQGLGTALSSSSLSSSTSAMKRVRPNVRGAEKGGGPLYTGDWDDGSPSETCSSCAKSKVGVGLVKTKRNSHGSDP